MANNKPTAVLLALALMSAGCFSQRTSTRLEAPSTYTIASKPITVRSYPEFSQWHKSDYAAMAPGERVPTLPPPDGYGTANNSRLGLQPATVSMNAQNGEELAKVQVNNLDPNGLNPVEQLIYGGSHPDHDKTGEYKFNVRDRMSISVRGHAEFEGEVTVGQDGTFRVPNTDDFVPAKGLTVVQIQKQVAEKIAPYIKDTPQVKVSITFARGEYYYIFGQVANSGRFPMGVTPIRLSEAIFRANSTRIVATLEENREERLREEMEVAPRESFGLSEYANLMQVSVITPHRTSPTRTIYNVKEALFQGKTGNDPIVTPGQIIFVPSTFDKRIINFFNRFIAPIKVIGQSDAEAGYWYGRVTGNTIKGVKPTVYEVKDSQ